MYKTNSLNHIIPTRSMASTPYLPHLHNSKNPYNLVHDHQGNLRRKYQMTVEEFANNSHLFQWRKLTHHPIPKITHINRCTEPNQPQFVSIFTEHINTNFTDLRPLKLEQIMYCMSQMLLGYQEIFARLGFTCIQERLIGLNTKGQILLWVNQNLLFNGAQHQKLLTEKQIVSRIIQLLQNKSKEKYHVLFTELKNLQLKFRIVLDFIMAFKNKYKLKIIPKISLEVKQIGEKMVSSNTFSTRTQHEHKINPLKIDMSTIQMKTSNQIRNSHSESQFLAGSKANSNQCSVVRNYPSNRTSIMQSNINNTPTNNNLTSSIHQKSAPKINFSYSQKRQQVCTPKQSFVARDYTSDKNLPLLNKLHSETNAIKEFTLEDKRSVNEPVERKKRRGRYNPNKKIVRIYNITYTPSNDSVYLQTQLDLKRSATSYVSQSSFTSKDKLFGKDVCQNKTSMTTNHRSAITQSFQSLGKSSNDDEYYNRKNELFTSNSSHRATYSIIKSSFVENEQGKNAVSFVIGNAHDGNPPSPLNHHTFMTSTNNIKYCNQRRKDLYTFGGLMTPLLDQTHQLKQSTTIPESNYKHLSQQVQFQQKFILGNQINTKSIDQLYNNLYFNSEKKSMIMDQAQYNIKLSPVKEQVHSHVNQSFVIDLSEVKGHQPLSHAKKSHSERSIRDFLTPKIGQGNAFDYNQWRGIKGLLNESNVFELKESIHYGPDIRSPLNIKLQLLDKFGRQIGQSILPSTPSGGHHSRAHSIYTINTEEHSVEYY